MKRDTTLTSIVNAPVCRAFVLFHAVRAGHCWRTTQLMMVGRIRNKFDPDKW